MKPFIKEILESQTDLELESDEIFNNSPLIKYLDSKMGAINGNSKTRRSLANIYAIYSILYFYEKEYYNNKDSYRNFYGYEYTQLFHFYRSLYGGQKLQNHALNSRVNGEFKNKIVKENENDLIIINDGKYAIHIDYLYVNNFDISRITIKIVEEYIKLLTFKDNKLISDLEDLISLDGIQEKKEKISDMLDENAEARIFEIISYAILKNHYSGIKVFIGFDLQSLKEEYLSLYKTGRTNANDGGIDFVMRPLGRFFQVTEVNSYDKYLLDIDKVMHFPITFVVKTFKSVEDVLSELDSYIKYKSNGMRIIEDRYSTAIEEIITINELKKWLYNLKEESVNQLLMDIDKYYKLELNLLAE